MDAHWLVTAHVRFELFNRERVRARSRILCVAVEKRQKSDHGWWKTKGECFHIVSIYQIICLFLKTAARCSSGHFQRSVCYCLKFRAELNYWLMPTLIDRKVRERASTGAQIAFCLITHSWCHPQCKLRFITVSEGGLGWLRLEITCVWFIERRFVLQQRFYFEFLSITLQPCQHLAASKFVDTEIGCKQRKMCQLMSKKPFISYPGCCRKLLQVIHLCSIMHETVISLKIFFKKWGNCFVYGVKREQPWKAGFKDNYL